MNSITHLHLLVHGFCYAEMVARGHGDAPAAYLDRERVCAEAWRARLYTFAPDEALAIIPVPGRSEGPSADYAAFAGAALGPRCFVLDTPFAGQAPGPAAADRMFPDTNVEEYDTTIHAEACCRQLRELLAERGGRLDREALTADAWGASFEGCVTKYSLNIRRLLELTRAIDIDLDMTVPDAAFLLDATCEDCITLRDGLRVFRFRAGNDRFACCTGSAESLEYPARRARLEGGAEQLTVRSKQGIRLWPDPEPYRLNNVPDGYDEPDPHVVTRDGDDLLVPVSSGYVYRLAKAPAFIFASTEMADGDFDRLLETTTLDP